MANWPEYFLLSLCVCTSGTPHLTMSHFPAGVAVHSYVLSFMLIRCAESWSLCVDIAVSPCVIWQRKMYTWGKRRWMMLPYVRKEEEKKYCSASYDHSSPQSIFLL